MTTTALEDLKVRLRLRVNRLNEKTKSLKTDLNMAEAFIKRLDMNNARDDEVEYLFSQINDLVDSIHNGFWR